MSWTSPKWYEYWIPGYGQALAARDLFTGNLSGAFFGGFGANELKRKLGSNWSIDNIGSAFVNSTNTPDLGSLEGQASSILGYSNEALLADREHNEMREDTAYQRAVADMRAAGLNPYTVGASPAGSSASSVGADAITNKLQVLGYILQLENLNAKNRQITNNAIGDILDMFSFKKISSSGSVTSNNSSTLRVVK